MRYRLIIPAWNEAAFLDATLASLVEAMRETDAVDGHRGELVVVDNNSSDATADIARARGVTVVFEPVNQIARARNAGAAGATGDALVFVDADTEIDATLLRAALANLAGGRVVGGGSTIAPDKAISANAQRGIDFWNRIGRGLKLAAGCFIYCRRDAFEAIGGFSKRVYAGEEIFLSRALKRWGRRRGMRFEVLDVSPARTSTRKLDWYGSAALARQAFMVFLPGGLMSKRLTRTWYDDRGPREREGAGDERPRGSP